MKVFNYTNRWREKQMKCNNGHIVSGDFCHVCENKPEKKKPKPLKKISDKLKPELRIYSIEGAKFMEENKICQYEGCQQPSKQLHHKKSRGANLNNKETWMAICPNNTISFIT